MCAGAGAQAPRLFSKVRTAKTERAAKPKAGCAAGGQQPATYFFTPSVVRGKVRRPVRTVSTTSVAAPPGLRRACMVRSLHVTYAVGGQGSQYFGTQNGAAAVGFGSGGSGASGSPLGTASVGNAGVVIIRYLGSPNATGGTITVSGGYTIHTFTSSGTYTA